MYVFKNLKNWNDFLETHNRLGPRYLNKNLYALGIKNQWLNLLYT